MTRINAGVSPQELPNKLLLAEHREITRIVPLARKRLESGKGFGDIPKEFTLGTGHVKFFYDKLSYIRFRYGQLLQECQARQFNITNKSSSFFGLPLTIAKDWTSTTEARRLIIERIESKGFRLITHKEGKCDGGYYQTRQSCTGKS